MPAAASVLGTPVATVDAPQSTAMIPLQDPGTNMTVTDAGPSGVQPIGTPGTAMVQQPTQWTPPQPGQVDTVQSALTDPEVAAGAVHQNWLSRILDTVGTILGGDKTIVATKHPDGSVSVEHNPSTTGEKWGRIAQAALGGAARGMAVGQGPGGAGRAFAAGTMAGLQQPQQTLAAANLEAKNMNAQQLAIANMALTHQGYLANAEQMRERGIKFTQEQADRYNAILKSTRDAPGSEDLGNFVGVSDLPSLQAKYPQAYAAHLGQNDKVLQFDPQIDPKTLQQTGSHITLLSKPLAERMMPAGTPPLTQSYYDPATKTIKSRDIDPSNMNRLEYSKAQQNLTKQGSDLALAVDKDLNKIPTNLEELATAAQTETNPVRKQQLLDAYAQREKDTIREKQAGRAPAAAGVSLGGVSGPEALAALPAGDAATVKAIGEGRQAPPSRFTKEGQRIMGMVNQVYPDYDSTQFPTYQRMREFMTSGAGGVGLNFVGTARNHLSELERTIPDNVSIPLIGSAINWAKNTATRATSPELKAFESARSAVSDEVAKAYKGGALGIEEHNQMMNLINESDSPGALRGSIGEFRRLLNGKLSSYQTQWNSAMPRGSVSPNSTLENLIQGTPVAPPPPAATTGGAANAPPSGITPMTPPAGQTRPGYVYGTGPQGRGWYRQ